MAFGKLQGFITGAPITYPGQNLLERRDVLLPPSFGLVWVIIDPSLSSDGVPGHRCGVGLFLGVLFVLPIGGADMPVVVSSAQLLRRSGRRRRRALRSTTRC